MLLIPAQSPKTMQNYRSSIQANHRVKRQLPFALGEGGGGLKKANVTFAFINRHKLGVAPNYIQQASPHYSGS